MRHLFPIVTLMPPDQSHNLNVGDVRAPHYDFYPSLSPQAA